MSQTYQSIKSLTPKQEKFCLLVSSGSSNSEAYREAYRAEKMLPNTVHREAYRLTQNPVVEARRWVLGRLQEEATYAGTAGARIRALELLVRPWVCSMNPVVRTLRNLGLRARF